MESTKPWRAPLLFLSLVMLATRRRSARVISGGATVTSDPLSRRDFLAHTAMAGAAVALLRAPAFLTGRDWCSSVQATGVDLLHDTFNGLLAFVVPGRDEYSVAQGVATTDAGGVEAGTTEALIATIDGSTPFIPGFSAVVAAILNDVALTVNNNPTGSFVSPFARLSFQEKTAVLQAMDGADPLKVLAGVLPAFVAFFVYSEAGAFDPVTRSLTGQPLGWTLSNYSGVADGRDELLGYF